MCIPFTLDDRVSINHLWDSQADSLHTPGDLSEILVQKSAKECTSVGRSDKSGPGTYKSWKKMTAELIEFSRRDFVLSPT